MVLAERNIEILRNRRRSAGPSPNGHVGTPDSNSDNDNSMKKNNPKSKSKQNESEDKIRVGRDYQAVCPKLIPASNRKLESLHERALLVWSPSQDISDEKLDEYISVAKEKYGYNNEQALGMLFWHKHDLERATSDLANFIPFSDEWTAEDKVLFEQAFNLHGKSFHRIRQMLPDTTIASLVKYYYSWKKTRNRQSVMVRSEKTKAKDDLENVSGNGKDDLESEAKDPSFVHSKDSILKSILSSSIKGELQQQPNNATSPASNHTIDSNSSSSSPITCTGCEGLCDFVNNTPFGKLCSNCYHHWTQTDSKRSMSGPYFGKRIRDRDSEEHKHKPPQGIQINHDDIVAFATANSNPDELLSNVDKEITTLLSQIQQNKQSISTLKESNSDKNEVLHPPDTTNRINSRWSNEELLFGVLGIRKFGKDFKAIAEAIGTKTEAHVRTFFVNYRRRYNLDAVVKEHEAMKEKKLQQLQEQQQNGKAC